MSAAAPAKSLKTKIQLLEEAEEAAAEAGANGTGTAGSSGSGSLGGPTLPSDQKSAPINTKSSDASAAAKPAPSPDPVPTESQSEPISAAALAAAKLPFADQLKEAARLASLDESETEPFKHRYESRDILVRTHTVPHRIRCMRVMG